MGAGAEGPRRCLVSLARVCEQCGKSVAVWRAEVLPKGWLRLHADVSGGGTVVAEVCSWTCAHSFVGDRVADEIRRQTSA